MSHNPYEAPQGAELAESQPEGFRWRLIPVAFIGGFGAICLLGGMFGFVMMAVGYLVGPRESNFGPRLSTKALTDGSVIIFTGFWLLFAAHIGWKGRWKTAIAMSLGLYLLALAVHFLIVS